MIEKSTKIFVIVLIILLVFVLIDTMQAKLFNNSPLIKISKNINGRVLECIDNGILVHTYVLTNGTKKTFFRWEAQALVLDVGDPIIGNEMIEDNNTNEMTDIEFVRTYNIVSNLNMTDTTGKYNFYVVQQFQNFEPIVIKVDKKYTLEEKANYEFTFKGNKDKEKEYTIQDIFNTFEIDNIEKTDKIGLDQRQDEI